MKAVFGLGNPGGRYRQSRHNLGFIVIDRYLERLRSPLSLRSLFTAEGWRARAGLRGRPLEGALVYQVKDDLLLVKPLTYMNRSGLAVRGIVEHFKLRLEDCLIVYDDFDIPWGKLRARARGGSGGHRGLESIIAALESEEIPRLRVGIGSDHSHGDLTDYVLGSFTPEELEEIDQVLNGAVAAIDIFYEEGIERMMDEVNRAEPA